MKRKSLSIFRAELKNSQYKVRFGLLLEAYSRYCGDYAEDLGRQVRTVDKLTYIAELIQNTSHDEISSQVRWKNFYREFREKVLYVFKKNFLANILAREENLQNLQYFRSPLDPNIELGQLMLVKSE